MRKFNLEELVSGLQEDRRELDIGDNVAVFYKGDFTPVKINGAVREELKTFKGSFCICYEKELERLDDYAIKIETLVLEEFSDSPFSIYIDETGFVNADEYGDICTIEIGTAIRLEVVEGHVVGFEVAC